MSSIADSYKEIISLCQKLSAEYGNNASDFSDGTTPDAITAWENSNDILIPESYKEWLILTESCKVLFDVLNLFPLKKIIVGHKDFPDELVVIGSVFGSGDSVCFSKSTGEIIRYNAFADAPEKKRFDDFNSFLEKVVLKHLKRC
ncbi:MAG: SMI1/KNR4 family protein [Ruminococcus sp.]|nr:SMI1/KNR4 family protein [Ruminococcus sp.]